MKYIIVNRVEKPRGAIQEVPAIATVKEAETPEKALETAMLDDPSMHYRGDGSNRDTFYVIPMDAVQTMTAEV